MPVRIYDISKKLGLENKQVLSKAKELGIAARVASSSLDKITAEYLEQQLILPHRTPAPPPSQFPPPTRAAPSDPMRVAPAPPPGAKPVQPQETAPAPAVLEAPEAPVIEGPPLEAAQPPTGE